MSIHSKSNVTSQLLSDQENESIFNLLGRGCVTLTTAVVQLYLAEAVNIHVWNKHSCGVVCFVKDNAMRTFFIRLYDPVNLQLSWEQEVYIQFKYRTPREYFHTFEAHDCQAGLNFASEDEASQFKKTVEGKLMDRHNKRLERKKQQGSGTHISAAPASGQGNISLGPGPSLSSGSISPNKPGVNSNKEARKSIKQKGKEKGKKKITKADISTPTHFRHVSHVGWDPTTGLDMEKLDPEMKALFDQIGIDNQADVDEETMDFIYDFVDKHGGLNAVREDLARRKLPPLPVQSAGHTPTSLVKPPREPTRPQCPAPPTPPTPPHREVAGIPHGRTQKHPIATPPPPPSRDGRGVPPPPPPVASNTRAPPPPPAPAPPIVSAARPPPPPIKKSRGGGPLLPSANSVRTGLLQSIVAFKGTTLKHIDPDQGSSTAASDEPGGIAAALMDALMKRKPALQYSDDDGNSDDLDDDDDDEWDD